MSKTLPNDPVYNNPAVESKFDRSHGKGLTPPHLSWPGQTAPVTGTKVSGHTQNGAKIPRKGTLTLGKGNGKL